MDAQWIKSPGGRRVLEHWADPRPSWLWSADGRTLIWRNMAARLFHGRGKGKAGKSADLLVPIRGQVARLIRLGSLNRASLSRMQFLAGDRPVSATCACTPIALSDDQAGLLVVDVDPVDMDIAIAASRREPLLERLLPAGSDYLLLDGTGEIAGGSPRAITTFGPVMVDGRLPSTREDGDGVLPLGDGEVPFTRFKAGPGGATLLVFAGPEQPSSAETASDAVSAPPPAPREPLLPLGLPPLPSEPQAARPPIEDDWVEPLREPPGRGLTSLFDRLADDSALFAPLRPDEDFVPPGGAPTPGHVPAVFAAAAAMEAEQPPTAETAAVPGASEAAQPAAEAAGAPATPAAAIEIERPQIVADERPTDEAAPVLLYRVVARRFIAAAVAASGPAPTVAPVEAGADDGTIAPPRAPAVPDAAAQEEGLLPVPGGEARDLPSRSGSAAEQSAAGPPVADAESVERASRYNFDELSRILNDRVGNLAPGEAGGEGTPPERRAIPTIPSATPQGALVTLGGETLVLNRLPLGILVFRDQQVLFANRAITEMTGYESVESLRNAGLASIFPAASDERPEAGPVNHLVQRDGTLVPVTARLQSVSWQGKPALMLSASATEVRTGHESAVRAFAEHFAAACADGFIETNRAGMVSLASAEARLLLRRGDQPLVGRSITDLVAPAETEALQHFLERPARFAETARPAITVQGIEPGTELLLFAQGQAGVVSGYFGFVRRTEGALLPGLAAPQDADPALLARLSRGVRRPLNTIIGFSDLIASQAFGPLDNARYLEYARDVRTAGQEIAALVDELDDFARLRDGRYAARPSDIDLAALLDSSLTRVRGQANAVRVLLRSAVSERLPRIRADRPSLAQAILNLLASAIDDTPPGGSVVLSAHVDDAGGIAVNVRDSAPHAPDIGERFVVFRDGVGRDGETLAPVRSSVGLVLTRALLAVNGAQLGIGPTAGTGTLFSLTIPPENVVLARQLPAGAS